MAYIVKQSATHGRINVFLAENHHIPQKGPRQTRTYIGILDVETNELILSSKQPEPNEALIELLSAKGITYNNKKANGPGRKQTRKTSASSHTKLINSIEKSGVFEIGRLNAFNYLAKESGLSACLSNTYGEVLGKRLLSAAIYQASEAMPFYLAGEWADDTGVGEAMSSSSLSRMLDEVGKNSELFNTFFTHWIKACGKPISVIHDTTSISSYSNSNDDIEWGYNRDCEQLPQINIALVVAKSSRLPIWFRMVSGSVPDVASLKLTCKILKSLGLKEFSFSLDRGYFSRSNLLEMLRTTIGFTLGAPTSQGQANQLVLSNKEALESIESSFLFNGKRMRHVTCEYLIEDKKGENMSVPGHLFLDLSRREAAACRMETTILELEQIAKESKFSSKAKADSWINENTGKLSDFFKVEGSNKQWCIVRNIDEITKNISTAGVALILTSRLGLSAKEVLEDYRCRDIAEKVFDTLKNGIDVNRLRTANSNQINGRLFVAFIAVILRALIETKLKQKNLLSKYSIDEALAILKKIKQLKLPDESTVNIEIPKKARIIKEAIESKIK